MLLCVGSYEHVEDMHSPALTHSSIHPHTTGLFKISSPVLIGHSAAYAACRRVPIYTPEEML